MPQIFYSINIRHSEVYRINRVGGEAPPLRPLIEPYVRISRIRLSDKVAPFQRKELSRFPRKQVEQKHQSQFFEKGVGIFRM